MRRAIYAIAVAAYVFLAAGLLHKALVAMMTNGVDGVRWAAVGLSLFETSIVLAPLCVIVSRFQVRIWLLLVCYVALTYVGLIGAAVIAGLPLSFGSPDTPVSSQTQSITSLVFLVIFAVPSFLPTALIWGLAKAFYSQRSRVARR